MSATNVLPLAEGEHRFRQRLPQNELRAAERIVTLQINVGLFCNLACKHCHVGSSPNRTSDHENMSAETANRILEWLEANPGIQTVDLTGGSPEVNPEFRRLVRGIRSLGIAVMDRCNPTIISYTSPTGETYDWIPAFLAEHHVRVVASLPCYLEENVRQQRGYGSFDASIEGLRRLNEVGYGSDPKLQLHLVYNPNGPHLPPAQDDLADAYHRELKERYGLQFNELWTITNMPIQRWRDDLERDGRLGEYMSLLVESFNPGTVDGLMCRHQIHIDSQGKLFDCDFNYALDLSVPGRGSQRLWDVTLSDLQTRKIAVADHCYGCTAGSGSSCGGALT